jgi:hypothetical protein
MRALAITILALSGLVGSITSGEAEPPSCKVCADQQKACMKNYAGPTCKTEYQMCMKSCKK